MLLLDIGHEKDAFIHYSDLSPYIRSVRRFSSECFQGRTITLIGYF
jgi:ribonuclease G